MLASLDRLAEVQEAAGRRLPMIAYPNEQVPPSRPDRFTIDYTAETRFAELRHQPTADTLKAWGVLSKDPERTVSDMLEVQQTHGFDGVAWDTKHGKSIRHGLQFEDPEGMVAALGQKSALGEIHLNLTGEDPDIIQRIVDGELEKTHHGRIVDVAVGSLAAAETLLIVTEVAASDWRRAKIRDTAFANRMLVRAITEIASRHSAA